MSNIVEQLLNYALVIAAKIDRPLGKGTVYLQLAEAWQENGPKSRCLEILGEVLIILDRLKHPDEKAKMLAWAARIYSQAGDSARSREQFTRATLLARAAETANQKIESLYRIAAEYAAAGLLDESTTVLTDLRETVLQSGNEIDIPAELIDLAEIEMDIGRLEKARETLGEALPMAEKIQDNWFRALRLVEIAEIYPALGGAGKALAILEKALSIVQGLETLNQPYFLFKIVQIYFASGASEKARQVLARAREIIDSEESPYSRSQGLVELAGWSLQLEDTAGAADLLSRAAQIAGSIESLKDRMAVSTEIASTWGKVGQLEPGRLLAEQVRELCESLPDKKSELIYWGDLALVYRDLKEDEKATTIVSRLIEVVRETNIRTAGLGAIAADLAESGDYLAALRLAGIIREPEAKAGALVNIAQGIRENRPENEAEVSSLLARIISEQ
jgi:tetratricopeptide (TPR) repeat protein